MNEFDFDNTKAWHLRVNEDRHNEIDEWAEEVTEGETFTQAEAFALGYKMAHSTNRLVEILRYRNKLTPNYNLLHAIELLQELL